MLRAAEDQSVETACTRTCDKPTPRSATKLAASIEVAAATANAPTARSRAATARPSGDPLRRAPVSPPRKPRITQPTTRPTQRQAISAAVSSHAKPVSAGTPTLRYPTSAAIAGVYNRRRRNAGRCHGASERRPAAMQPSCATAARQSAQRVPKPLPPAQRPMPCAKRRSPNRSCRRTSRQRRRRRHGVPPQYRTAPLRSAPGSNGRTAFTVRPYGRPVTACPCSRPIRTSRPFRRCPTQSAAVTLYADDPFTPMFTDPAVDMDVVLERSPNRPADARRRRELRCRPGRPNLAR